MTYCETYVRHGKGSVSDDDFRRHAETCKVCLQLLELDRQLLAAAGALAPTVRPAEPLWPAVDAALNEKTRRYAWRWGARIAAVLLLAAGGVRYWATWTTSDSTLLMDRQAIESVEAAERAHVAAIEALQARADQEAVEVDPQLQNLFALRLAAIDRQIERCREAIDQNPSNASVRRFLLAALREKEATLRRMIEEPFRREGA